MNKFLEQSNLNRETVCNKTEYQKIFKKTTKKYKKPKLYTKNDVEGRIHQVKIPFVNTTSYQGHYLNLPASDVLNLGAQKISSVITGIPLLGTTQYDLSYNLTSSKRPSSCYRENHQNINKKRKN